MIPSPPALETADASCARAIQPIGAWTIGYSIPSISVTRVLIMRNPGRLTGVTGGAVPRGSQLRTRLAFPAKGFIVR